MCAVGRGLFCLEFDVFVYVGEEPSSFVSESVCSAGSVSWYVWCFVFGIEFCFLYAYDVRV